MHITSAALHWSPSSLFFFNETPTTEIYTFPYTTLFRSPPLPGCAGSVRSPGHSPGHFRPTVPSRTRSEEHTSELQSRENLVCRLLLEKKKKFIQRELPVKKKKNYTE